MTDIDNVFNGGSDVITLSLFNRNGSTSKPQFGDGSNFAPITEEDQGNPDVNPRVYQ